MAYSAALLLGLNPADGRNAITAASATFKRENKLDTDPVPFIYENTNEVAQALADLEIGGANMALSEYWLLHKQAGFDRFCVNIRQGTPYEVYVVLARTDASIASLADLAGKRIGLLTSASMDLATVWLDVELARLALPSLRKFVGTISESAKVATVVLPVFFQRSDACITTLRGYRTMIELNPQVGKQLRVLATSPEIVSMLYGFRHDLNPEMKESVIRGFVETKDSVSGRQAITMFQIDEIAERPSSFFDSTLALLDEHARLCPEASEALITKLQGTTPAGP